MKILQSNLGMASHHLIAERYESHESLRFWAGDPSSGESGQGRPAFRIRDQVTLSSPCLGEEDPGCGRKETVAEDVRNEVIRLLLERLTGRRIKLASLSDFAPQRVPTERSAGGVNHSAPVEPSAGFGLSYERYDAYSERETLRFVSRGVVLTEEGREIRFELQFGLERAFTTVDVASIRLGDARRMDPLVVDLNGGAAILMDATFSFDMDSDGVEERFAALGPGKGFLALDRNGDGAISDGSELFGPRLGDGFLELAGLDRDGNGWIDENDPEFTALGVWSRDPEGNDRFLPMAESGIGAIYTGRIATLFSHKDAENNLRGELKETGLYLKESGQAALIQELDLVI